MRRKILMGVLALALPTGLMATMSTSAVAGKAPPNRSAVPASRTVTSVGSWADLGGHCNIRQRFGSDHRLRRVVHLYWPVSAQRRLEHRRQKNAKLAKSDPLQQTAGIKYLTTRSQDSRLPVEP